MSKRTLSIVLALLLILSATTALGYGTEYEQGQGNPVTLKVFMNNPNFDQSTWGKDIVSSTIIEKTGVNLEFDIAPTDDNQKLNLLIASNDLPDLVMVNRNTAPEIAMRDNDRIYSLDELAAKYAPSFLEDPFIVGNRDYICYTNDGIIYSIPSEYTDRTKLHDGVFILPAPGYYIREDILKAIGEPALKTPADLEAALEKALDYDYTLTHPLFMWSPLSVDSESSSVNILFYAMGGEGKYFEGNGKLESKIRNPKYLETMQYINRMYNKGLINVSDFTDTSDLQEVINNSGTYFASVGAYWRAIVPHDNLPKEIEGAQIAVIEPLLIEGADKIVAPFTGLNGWGGMYITKNTQHPDRAMWFMQYLLSDEGQTLVTAGIENEHWAWGGDEKNWIVPIGEAKNLMTASWNDWVSGLGTYKYNWIARNYYDSAFCWGLAIEDEFKRDLYATENAGTDYSAYENINPDASSDEFVIMTKFNDMWKNYLSKMCLAASEADVTALYNEFIAAADQMGLAKVEDIWTANYKAKNGL